MPFGIAYALLVYATFVVYPIVFADITPVNIKGVVILYTPLLPLIIIGTVLLASAHCSLPPAGRFWSKRSPASSRLGRQLTLYAPDHTRKVQKYVFYAQSESEAGEIQRALSEP